MILDGYRYRQLVDPCYPFMLHVHHASGAAPTWTLETVGRRVLPVEMPNGLRGLDAQVNAAVVNAGMDFWFPRMLRR